jgi:hypothetical protein
VEAARPWLTPHPANQTQAASRDREAAPSRPGRRRREYAVREVPAMEAGPVLKRYVGVATATRPYFQADKDAPVEDFVAEADRHPVFELLPIGEDRSDDHRGR